MVRSVVSIWKFNISRKLIVVVVGNFNLVVVYVELCIIVWVGGMKSDGFCFDEVVISGDFVGDFECLFVVVFVEGVGVLGFVVGVVVEFVDFELWGRGVIGCFGVVDFGYVDDDGVEVVFVDGFVGVGVVVGLGVYFDEEGVIGWMEVLVFGIGILRYERY